MQKYYLLNADFRSIKICLMEIFLLLLKICKAKCETTRHPCDDTMLGNSSEVYFGTCREDTQVAEGSLVEIFGCFKRNNASYKAPTDLVSRYTPHSLHGQLREKLNNGRYTGNTIIDFDNGEVEEVGSHVCVRGRSLAIRAGVYEILGVLEYQGYDWIPMDGPALLPVSIPSNEIFHGRSIVKVLPMSTSLPETTAIVSAGVREAASDKNCTSGESPGIWLDGIFTPRACKYRQVPLTEYSQCAAKYNNSIHWLGDSNGRRMIKSLYESGNFPRWCTDPPLIAREWNVCKCHDDNELNNRKFFITREGIKFTFVKGLTSLGGEEDSYKAVREIPNGTRLLIIGHLVNWDAAFGSLDEYIQKLKAWLPILEEKVTSMRPTPRIILRLGNFYCCNNSPRKKYPAYLTRKKIAIFNKITLESFQNSSIAYTLWNPYAYGASLPHEESLFFFSYHCQIGHFNSTVVETDLNVLLNMICN